MNVFVLCTGRCGSLAFAKACGHATNFTAGHETRAMHVGPERLAYPAKHIEVDNRLSWFLGELETRWGDNARYVHLTRDPQACAESFANRKGIVRAFGNAVLMGCEASRLQRAAYYVETVTANISAFLARRRHVMEMRIEDWRDNFPEVWDWMGADGDLSAALDKFTKGHNRRTR